MVVSYRHHQWAILNKSFKALKREWEYGKDREIREAESSFIDEKRLKKKSLSAFKQATYQGMIEIKYFD